MLQLVARELGDAFPGIESTPGVCGGEACIFPLPVAGDLRRLGHHRLQGVTRDEERRTGYGV